VVVVAVVVVFVVVVVVVTISGCSGCHHPLNDRQRGQPCRTERHIPHESAPGDLWPGVLLNNDEARISQFVERQPHDLRVSGERRPRRHDLGHLVHSHHAVTQLEYHRRRSVQRVGLTRGLIVHEGFILDVLDDKTLPLQRLHLGLPCDTGAS
jgi:hypothetical protein